jgi:pyruvate dehydrogenase E2 component (dihydrolipoamide acetyltransferase)
MEISSLAKQRKLTPEHMGGASMTISSLGNLGGQAFTPIINPPEVAILGLSKIIVNEKMTSSGMEQQKLLPLSLSYDHRVINGADAARFCTYLKNVLEDVWRLIL